MKIGPFQYRDVHEGDDANPFELVGQMFRQLREIVDQINRAPFASDNVLRRASAFPTQKAADERPVFIVPPSIEKMTVEDVALSVRTNLAAGTVFSLKRYTASTSFQIAAFNTTTMGAMTAYRRYQMDLENTEKLVLSAKDVITLAISGNVPDEGVVVLTTNEVFP